MTEPSTAVESPPDVGTPHTLHLLGPEVVDSLFDLDLAYTTQHEAFVKLARGDSWQPDKIGGGHAADESTLFCYASRLDRRTGPVSKFGSVNPTNSAVGKPTIHATVTLLHPTTGIPVAILDGTAITARRTAAASALAARALALPGADTVAVLGAGQQALSHIRALHAVLDAATFRIWAPRAAQIDEAVLTLTGEGISVVTAETIRSALDNANIVVTATRSTEPLFEAQDLTPGSLVISVGSFEEHRREIGLDTLRRSSDIVVDHAPTAEAHSGPIVNMRSHGDLTALVELGSVLTDSARVRSSPNHSGIVTYLSVGLGVQDAAAAWAIYEKAQTLGLCTEVPW